MKTPAEEFESRISKLITKVLEPDILSNTPELPFPGNLAAVLIGLMNVSASIVASMAASKIISCDTHEFVSNLGHILETLTMSKIQDLNKSSGEAILPPVKGPVM